MLGNRRVYHPRGMLMGGSSAINGMVYIRGNHFDYDRWAAARPQRWVRLVAQACEVVLHFRRCFSVPALAMGVACGCLAWFAHGLGFWWLLGALGQPLPLTTAVFIYAFAMLIGGISFMPGGLGSSEAAMVALLAVCRA